MSAVIALSVLGSDVILLSTRCLIFTLFNPVVLDHYKEGKPVLIVRDRGKAVEAGAVRKDIGSVLLHLVRHGEHYGLGW